MRWKGHGCCTFPQCPGTGKVIYKPSILDEKQLHLKQDQSRSHKTAIYPRTVTTLQHVSLQKEVVPTCS